MAANGRRGDDLRCGAPWDGVSSGESWALDGLAGGSYDSVRRRVWYPSRRRFVATGSVSFMVVMAIVARSVWGVSTAWISDPREVGIIALCVLLTMFYHETSATGIVSVPHTIVPVVVAVAFFVGDLELVAPVLLLGLMASMLVWRRSLFAASIEVLGVILSSAPVPIVFALFSRGGCVGEGTIANCYPADIFGESMALSQHWLLPAVVALVAVVAARFVIDMAIAVLLGYSTCSYVSQYSVQRMTLFLAMDVLAATVVGIVMLYDLRIGQRCTALGRPYVVCFVYAITMDQYFRIRRNIWVRRSLYCFMDVVRMMPLPQRNPENSVVEAMQRRFGMFTCSAETLVPGRHESYSFVASKAIDFNGRNFHLVMERNIWNRAFLASDRYLLDSLASVLEEIARVGREISAVQGESEADALTGVRNYRSFIGMLRSLAERESAADAAILYVDVDHLRRINSRYGYAVGNEVLKTVASRLTSVVPDGSVVGRIGDDEFGVILEGAPSVSGMKNLVSDVLDVVSAPVRAGGQLVEVSLSVGTSVSGQGKSLADLMTEAAQRLSVSTDVPGTAPGESGKSAADALAAVRAVDEAIDQAVTANLYIPQFDMRSGMMSALRVIGRIPDGQGGYVSENFARLQAERLGKAGELAVNVLDQATRDIEARSSILGFVDRIELMVSRRAASDPAFMSRLEDLHSRRPDLRVDCLLDGNALAAVSDGGVDYLRPLLDVPNVGLVINVADVTFKDLLVLLRHPVQGIRMDRRLMPDDWEERGRDAVKSVVDWALRSGMMVIVSGLTVAEQLDSLPDEGPVQIEGPVLCNPLTIGELVIRMESMGRGCFTPHPNHRP